MGIEGVLTMHWSLDSINWEIILLLESIRWNCYEHYIRVQKLGLWCHENNGWFNYNGNCWSMWLGYGLF